MSEGQRDLDEKEKAIMADVDRGLKYSEIAKTHHVSPKTIKAIKDKAKKKPTPPDEGEIASTAFELFRKGYRPDRVVIKIKMPPEIIMKLFEQYAEMKRRILLSKDDLADLDEIYETIGVSPKDRNLKTLRDRVRKLTEHFQRTQIPCSKCGKPIDLADESSIHFLKIINFIHHGGCPQ